MGSLVLNWSQLSIISPANLQFLGKIWSTQRSWKNCFKFCQPNRSLFMYVNIDDRFLLQYDDFILLYRYRVLYQFYCMFRIFVCAPCVFVTPNMCSRWWFYLILCVNNQSGWVNFNVLRIETPCLCVKLCLKQALEGDPAPLWTQHKFVLTPLDLGIFKWNKLRKTVMLMH